jgi:mRNA-degrading endonuclease RelE of RelBE toxin-antitoxin system
MVFVGENVAIKPELTSYGLEITRQARKALEKLSTENALRLEQALLELASTAHGDVKSLGDNYAGEFRFRVGDLRIFFDVLLPERIIRVTDLEKRGEAYKKKSKR